MLHRWPEVPNCTLVQEIPVKQDESPAGRDEQRYGLEEPLVEVVVDGATARKTDLAFAAWTAE